MKKIGFVDYYLDEWHANHYIEWLDGVNKKLGTDYAVKYAWAEIPAPNGTTTEAWCKQRGVKACGTVEELCEKSDCVIILAPSDPDTHLRYAERVLPFGKRTYIDKTFAPDYGTARKIFALAEEHGTPFFSTSALRCANEMDALVGAKALITTGGGSNLEEYVIHQIEMAVRVLGAGAKRVRAERQAGQYICRVDYGDRAAALVYDPSLPFAVTAQKRDGESVTCPIESDFFHNLLTEIVRFFEGAAPFFDVAETLEVMKIREGIIRAKGEAEEWLNL